MLWVRLGLYPDSNGKSRSKDNLGSRQNRPKAPEGKNYDTARPSCFQTCSNNASGFHRESSDSPGGSAEVLRESLRNVCVTVGRALTAWGVPHCIK